MPAVTGWERVLQAAEKYEPALRRELLAALETLRDSVSVDEIVRALEGSSAAVAELVAAATLAPSALAVLESMVSSASRAGTSWLLDFIETPAGRRGLPTGRAGPFTIDFAAIDERASQWASQHAGELIKGIDDETRAAIRAVIARAPVEGITVDQQARLIRQAIGLNERQARALFNRYDALTRQGVSPARIERQTNTYYQRLLRQRAEMIARTETRFAAQASQQAAWRQAAAEGLLDAGRSWQEFSALDDACPVCRELDGSKYPVDDPGPSTHPSCRCALILVFGDTMETAKTVVSKPLGEYADWGECVRVMTRKLGSKAAAERYCGFLEQRG